jgi:hypothetical protein
MDQARAAIAADRKALEEQGYVIVKASDLIDDLEGIARQVG